MPPPMKMQNCQPKNHCISIITADHVKWGDFMTG